ncbi:triacylglycerol lipase [Massilia sp. TS11]|uniref:esterase/lipase family protein n=1 Tax=Massilia sp. TS11 TaxID=2908003 RepID=UPI001EDB225E|nr:GPI inositol-deacylase [Massilia sp. TS11]MCG2584765.1 GPI inositol-deacylase [Massilia sp. TS11]
MASDTNPVKLKAGADLRGAVRLAVEAVAGVAALTEAVHLNILEKSPGRFLAKPTSFVYRMVQGVNRLVGGGLDAALGRLADADGASGDWQGREPVLAALNGVLGDRLEHGGNPLAIAMAFRREGRPLVHPVPGATGRILILVHGLCMNDLQWLTDNGGHGSLLARERGYTLIYLHYNTGRHIALNGADFAAQIEALLDLWPVPVEELAIIGHSMGGLVARSACAFAEQAQQRWRGKLRRLVTLGSPHHGAPLERGGNWLTLAMGMSSYSAPFARLAKIRSAGITDLRHGSVLREDWQDKDRFAAELAAQFLPLPEGVACFAMAGTVAAEAGRVRDALIGDGLVPLNSALGIAPDLARCLTFSASATLPNTHHMDLLTSPEVARQLLDWLD